MCLSIPSKIKSIDTEMNTCVVDTMGVERSASLDLIDQEVKVGDYVLIHIGFAMNKIDEEYALESLKPSYKSFSCNSFSIIFYTLSIWTVL